MIQVRNQGLLHRIRGRYRGILHGTPLGEGQNAQARSTNKAQAVDEKCLSPMLPSCQSCSSFGSDSMCGAPTNKYT